MRKKFSHGVALSIAAVMVFMLMIACSNGDGADVAYGGNRVGMIGIGSSSSAMKAISTTVTYSSEVEDLYWYYKATKKDDGYTSGQTNGFVAVAVDDGNTTPDEAKGLSGKILKSNGFSYGLWKIELKGFKTKDSTANVEYEATIDNFLVNADMNYANADIKAGDDATTTIEFGDIYFSAENFNQNSSFSLTVKDNDTTIINSMSNTATHVSGQTDKYEVRFSNLNYGDNSVSEGEHTMEFVLTQTLSGTGNTTIEAAVYTLKFNVMKGTKTVISGDMIKNDQTGMIQINGVQSVPETVLSKIIPVNDGAEETAATVRTTTTIQIGDLKVTYPAGAIIVPGPNGLAENEEGVTSDGTVGFEYKNADEPVDVNSQPIEIVIPHTSAKYELSLSAHTTDNNNTLLKVEKKIGAGLEILHIYHGSEELGNGSPITNKKEYYSYDSTTGVLTLNVLHASDFYVVSKQAVASIGDTLYYSLESALEAVKNLETIKLLQDCSYATNGSGLWNITTSMTLDGNGKTISGYGSRSVNKIKTTLAINDGGDSTVDVTLKNLTINNSGAAGRPIETRGNIGSINFDNVTINATGDGNTQCLTIGASQDTSANININDSTFNAGSAGYPVITFNPVEMTIDDSAFIGYCGVYFKQPDASAGSFGSVLTATNSTFDAPNIYDGQNNSFGVFVMCCDDISIHITNCKINSEASGTSIQTIFSEDSYIEEETNKNIYTVDGESTIIKGQIFDKTYEYNFEEGRVWNIKAGLYTENPSSYLAEGYKAVDNGNGTWTVSAQAQ